MAKKKKAASEPAEAPVPVPSPEPAAPAPSEAPPPWREPWSVRARIYGLLALSAVLMFLGFTGFGIWPLGYVAMWPALFVLDPRETAGGFQREAGPRPGRTFFFRALFFGTVAYTGGFYWIEYTLRLFSGFPIVLSSLFSTVFWAFQGLQFVAMLFLVRAARKNDWPFALALPAAYLATEHTFPMLFEHYYGSTLITVPVMVQIAELGGPELATLAIFLPSGALYDLLLAYRRGQTLPRLGPAIAAGYLVFVIAFGLYRIADVEARMAAASRMEIGVVQPNLGLFDRFEDPRESLRAELRATRELEAAEAPDLVVWPESSVAFWMDDAVNLRRSVLPNLHTPVLFGSIRHGERNAAGDRREHNTALLTDAEGDVVGTYDKTYLLAFGEYLPFGETFPELYDISENSGRFSPGTHVHPLELPLGPHATRGERPEVVRIGTVICYEDIVSSFVRRAVNEGDPHILINMTVDTWFGDTHEPNVHLSLAAFRAIEHRRFLVRATNSGVSAVVDALGRIVHRTPVFERTSFAHEVRLLSGHTTLFGLLGHWPGLVAVALSIWMVMRRRAESALGPRS